jgi:hypothetical protein
MPSGEQNTYGLPDGEAIRVEMAAIFREQRIALLGWMDSEGFKAFGLPDAWPSWESLRLGASDIAARVKAPIADIWHTFLDVADPVVAARIDMQAMTLGREVNATTTGLLNRLLEKVTGLFNSGKATLAQSIKALRKGVVEEIKPMEAWRARRIAVTEAARAYHRAFVELGKEDGDVVGWKWLAAADACPICSYIEDHAQFVPIGEPFAILGTGEYSVIEAPPVHPNCRCTIEEVLLSDIRPDWSATLINPVIPKASRLVGATP